MVARGLKKVLLVVSPPDDDEDDEDDNEDDDSGDDDEDHTDSDDGSDSDDAMHCENLDMFLSSVPYSESGLPVTFTSCYPNSLCLVLPSSCPWPNDIVTLPVTLSNRPTIAFNRTRRSPSCY
jgi:hypothetical protein